MKNKIIAVGFALVLPVFTAQAQQAAADKPSIDTSQKMKLTAQVESIDLQRNEITFRGPQGNTRTIGLGDDVPGLDKIEVGDIALVDYIQHLSIKVLPNDGSRPGSGSMSAITLSKPGETPGVVTTGTDINTASVEEINIEDNTFKLKWADGSIKQYVAKNPANLKKAEVGDIVVVAHTETLAIQMQELEGDM